MADNLKVQKESEVVKIERKWQKKWDEEKAFETKVNNKKSKYYALEMYAYPSGSGLHMGHAFNFTIGDILARYMRMKGHNVLYPTGYDSFGLPAENAAIKANVHPRDYTDKAMESFKRQQKALGFSYDWKRMLYSHDPEYYKWNQYFFLQFLKNGLAYRKKASVNWCPKCNSVLANEQVHSGKCWRHSDTEVEIKNLEQWFVKTTKYAQELLDKVDALDWPERIKAMQKNWIGRSEGSEIMFEVPLAKETNFVLLHGYTGSPDKNFFPWLKKELESRGYSVTVPNLPNSSNPTVMEQVNYVLKNCKFDENTILLGHSLGGPVSIKVVEMLKKPIKKLILCAGFIEPNTKDRSYVKTFDWKFNFDKIRNNVEEIKILRDVKDKDIRGPAADKIKSAIGGEIVSFEAKEQHICGEEEPQVLKACLNYWPIFTTRADTLMGVTFLVVSAQHHRLMELVTEKQKKEVGAFLKKIKSTSEKDAVELDKEGVFTGSYAIHPISGEKIPIWAGNFVVADYGSGMVMAVPAHDSRDYDFAKKYKIPIKQVIVPYTEITSGEDAIRKDKQTIERNSVFAIVKHWKEDKYFCLDWEKFKWKSFVIGGVEEGESFENAAIREAKEETGYQDIKKVTPLGFQTKVKYFARHKDVNRIGNYKAFLIELGSDKWIKPKEEETKNHKGAWFRKEEVKSFINLENNKYYWDVYLNGEKAVTEYGMLINSGDFDGLYSDEAKEHVTKFLESKKLGRKTINYKLRDWLISRQRYWGTPIPVVHCEKCGVVPVDEKDLPILLPDKVKFGEGNPLATNEKFVNAKCSKCGGKARRETDTMDTFFDSSWYYLRFTDNTNKKLPFEKDKVESFMPVDFYVGGAEHATMHLIYARFFTKALRDMGYAAIDEPFKRLYNQGMVHGEDGRVMSKSAGNGVDPLETANKYGADALRMFLVSVASPDKDFVWSSTGIESTAKVISKIYSLKNIKIGKSSELFDHKLNKTIKEVGKDFEYIAYNQIVIKIRALVESLEEEISKENLSKFVRLIAPFCPHVAEELWESIKGKGFVSLAEWPEFDQKKINDNFDKAEEATEKTVSDVQNILRIVKEKEGKEGKRVYLYVLPNEISQYNTESIGRRVGREVIVYAVNDKNKHDPQGKASKAKPGKPAIYVE